VHCGADLAVTEQTPYGKGLEAGKVLQRLDGHDAHLERINGSMEKVATELAGVKLALQRLADQAVSRDATVITTAAALKDAEQARRDQAERSWSPVSRLSLVLGVLVSLTALALYVTR